MHSIWDIRLQKCRDLENQVRGPSRSLEISPFDRAHTTSYWCHIVTMALSRVVPEIFNVKKCRDLEIRSEVTQGHWKWYHSIDCVRFPVSFLCNFVPKMHHFWDIRLQKCHDLENRVRDPSRSLEMLPFDRAHMTSYWRSIVTIGISHTVSEINGDFSQKSPNIPTSSVFNAPAEGVPLGIGYRRKGSKKLQWRGYQMVKKVLRWV